MQLVSSGLRIALDNGDGDVSFISHAHADHLNGVKYQKRIIASEETIALAGLSVENLSLPHSKLLHAGHILGSKQLFLEENGRTTVYTGDLRTRDSILFKGAEIPQCDRLIIDATYAHPSYRFPPNEEVYQSIAKWVDENKNSNLIIGCYDLGKAQEVIAILNQYSSVTPVINENAGRFSSIYRKFGVKLDYAVIGSNDAEAIMRDPFVAIVSIRHAKRYFAKKLATVFNRKTLSAVATGWAVRYCFNVDNAFPLSDHADFYDLKEYISQSGAKELHFIQGDGRYLRL